MNAVSKKKHTDGRELFQKYMFVMCERQSEKTYRLKSSAGEGIMHTYDIAEGIELIYSELEAYYPSIKETVHGVDYIEIMYIMDGHAEFEMENRRIVLADKGDICIFSSRLETKKVSFGNSGVRSLSIVFELEALKDALNGCFRTADFSGKDLFGYVLHADTCVRIVANDLLKNTFAEMVSAPGEYGEYYRRILTIKTIVALLDEKDCKKTDYRYYSGDTSSKVHAARKLLGEQIATDLSVEEVAEKVKLNRTTLQRVFKQMYGVTIFEYRTRIRMQESRNLLLDVRLTVTEIAGRCGYANASKFSATFKKYFGVTPLEWRKSL